MSGYQNTGTLTGTQLVSGRVGKALSFNGQTDYVQASDAASLDLQGNEITITAWIYPTSLGTQNIIVNKESSYEIGLNNGVLQAAVETTATGAWAWGGSLTIPRNVWTHVTFIYSSGATWYFYLNGTLRQTMSPAGGQTGNIVPSASALRIGQRSVGSYPFNGTIDEVRIYSRALSSADVAALFSPQTTLPARSFFKYNTVGENVEMRSYHNGSWIYTSRTFDTYGNILSPTDPNGVLATYAYSGTYGNAYVTSVTRAGLSESFVYDFGTGLTASKTDPRQLTTSYNYDLLGRVTTVVQPAVGGSSPTTYYLYDDVHDITTVYDPISMPRLLHYDLETLFNGSMEDLSGRGNFGTCHGTASVTGHAGLARSFNGTGAYVRAATAIL